MNLEKQEYEYESVGRFLSPSEMFEEWKQKNRLRPYEDELHEFLNANQNMSLIEFYNHLAESEDR